MVAAVAVVLVLFLLRPGASRLKTRITNSISRAVARPVEVGSVHLRFLPRPGFDLENLIVYEDPAFGAEPMLRAPEVVAVVRLTSLARGRLDIARLELTEPSLNLVRRPDGRWNWEALLERTARIPLAPTAKSRAESRAGFPYIEASSGRINFKVGSEKKPYALLDADFTLWQDSENAWGVRLKAQPLRTDMALSDTGVLRINGIWQRAGTLRETPLQFSLEWEQAQLGQLTKLFSGSDKGWRGEVRVDVSLSGSPAAMQVSSDASIQDFRRYDISSTDPLRLAAHCDAKYNSTEGVMHEIFCTAPAGNGSVTMHGDAGRPGSHHTNLAVDMENISSASLAQLARRTKKNLPSDLVATGTLQGNFAVREEQASSGGIQFQGRGEIANLRLQSPARRADFILGTIPFMLISKRPSPGTSARTKSLSESDILALPEGLRLDFGPTAVALGRPAAAQARGWIARSGYSVALRGEAEVSPTLRLASMLGLPALTANPEGVADLNLAIAGSWGGTLSGENSGFSPPEVTGTVQLRNIRASMRGANGPIEISSAELKLLPNEARIEKLNARAADARWTGSVSLPRGCGTPGACLVHFDLSTDEFRLSAVHDWLTSHSSERHWYQISSPVEPTSSFLNSLRASGKISVRRFLVQDISAENASAAISLERGKLRISGLRSNLLGGTCRGDWTGDFTAKPPVYAGSGTVNGISLEQVASAMHDPWISGAANGSYQLRATGLSLAAFRQSAEGVLEFDLRDGVLSHIFLNGDGEPLRITRWQGNARVRGGNFEIEKGNLVSPTGVYGVDGTASWARELNVKLAPAPEMKAAGSLLYSVTGTVAEPQISVTSAPETRAQLKP